MPCQVRYRAKMLGIGQHRAELLKHTLQHRRTRGTRFRLFVTIWDFTNPSEMKKWTSILIAAGTLGCGAAYEGPVDARFDGSEFRRTQGVPERGFGTFLSWVTNRQQVGWPDWVEIPPASAPPKRSEALRVQFVNHATVLVQLDNVNILTDPIWAERASPVSFAGPARHKAPGIAFESLPKIDAVVISHNHYDHMDVETLLRLQ